MIHSIINRTLIKITGIVIILFSSFEALAQTGSEGLSLDGSLRTIFIIATIIFFIWIVNIVIRMVEVVLTKRELDIYEKHGLQAFIDQKKADENLPFWKKLNRSLSDAVPIEKEQDILLDHDYDGIRELDNNLPPWWVYGFYFTIAIAVFYMGYYHVLGYGKSSTELYEMEMAEAQISIDKYLETQANRVDEETITLLTDEKSLADGKTIFANNCVACHLDHGGGSSISVGPNLTDEYWVHGGGIRNVFVTIKNGVPEKGMISWASQLSPGDMHKVASYILSLQGTNPPAAKAPEGELWVEPASE